MQTQYWLKKRPRLTTQFLTIFFSALLLTPIRAAEFFELQISISAISADGLIAVGSTSAQFDPPTVPIRWSRETGVELLGTLSGLERGIARGVSGDGNVVTGSSFRPTTDQPFIWSKELGITGISFPEGAVGAQLGPTSFDGNAVAGTLFVSRDESGRLDEVQAIRWTEERGIQVIGPLPGKKSSSAAFGGISADGTVISGSSDGEAFIWTEDSGMTGIGEFSGAGMSSDGNVVVGKTGGASLTEGMPTRWTAADGMRNIELPTGSTAAAALASNSDGSIIVGSHYGAHGLQPFVWDETNGPRDLAHVLLKDHGVDLEFVQRGRTGRANGISADGNTVFGSSVGNQGVLSWIVQLDRPLVVTSGVIGDFNGNAELDVEDLDLLVAELQSDRNVDLFDVNSDENVDHTDLTKWLSDAAVQDGFAEPYLPGDANLDGVINAQDLNAVGFHWLQDVALWSAGDFTADGKVNAADLNALGKNWLKELPLAAAETTAVPEPSTWLLAFLAFAWIVASLRPGM